MVLRSVKDSTEYDQFDITGGDPEWSSEVLAIVEKIVKENSDE